MTKYYVMEVQRFGSFRKADAIYAKSLQGAKKAATRRQVFCGTTLVIGDSVNEDGFILNPICYKNDEKWHSCNY